MISLYCPFKSLITSNILHRSINLLLHKHFIILPTNVHAVLYDCSFGKLKNRTILRKLRFAHEDLVNSANESYCVISLYPQKSMKLQLLNLFLRWIDATGSTTVSCEYSIPYTSNN